MYEQTIPWVVNYDKSAMPPYDLPELLVDSQGQKISQVAQWQTHRAELVQQFRDLMYGREVPLPDQVSYRVLSEKNDALDGRAIRREVELNFKMDNGLSHQVIMIYYLPAQAAQKVPMFIGLTFGGNHVISAEEDIQRTGLMVGDFSGEMMSRGEQTRRFPLAYLLGRGYGIAIASYHDFFPDFVNGWSKSIYRLFFSEKTLEIRLPDYTAIGAWSWGISRMADYLQQVAEVNPDQLAVFGHSRLGKTALWTGVRDERFKLVCVNDSGCGGAALSRRLYGETLFSMFKRSVFGQTWFNAVLESYAAHPETLPIDQHQLIALVAPRRVAIHSATEDQWADPEGEYLGAFHAGKVFELFGETPLASPIPPLPETPVGTDVSYLLRTGKHDLLLEDWEHYVAMADRIFKH